MCRNRWRGGIYYNREIEEYMWFVPDPSSPGCDRQGVTCRGPPLRLRGAEFVWCPCGDLHPGRDSDTALARRFHRSLPSVHQKRCCRSLRWCTHRFPATDVSVADRAERSRGGVRRSVWPPHGGFVRGSSIRDLPTSRGLHREGLRPVLLDRGTFS